MNMVMNTIMGMPEEQRRILLEELSKNPQLALALGMLVNPPQYGGGGIPMMNPYPFLFSQYSSSQKGESSSSLKDIAEAFKTIADTHKMMREGEDGRSEEIKELKGKLEGVTGNYNNLRLQMVEREKERDKENILTVDKIKELMREVTDEVIEKKGLARSPTDILRDVGEFVRAVNTLQSEVGRKEESFDDWMKRKKIEKEEEEKERRHREKMAELEAKKAHEQSIKQFLQAGIAESFKRGIVRGEDAKKEKVKVQNPLDDALASLLTVPSGNVELKLD
jgi:hypothetical protein